MIFTFCNLNFNGSAFAEGQEPSRVLGRYKVNSIVFNFVGERTYKDRTLLGKLGFRKGGYVDLTLADLGSRGLELFYLKKGFARVRVQLEHDRLLEGNVIYTIAQGPRVRIGKVAFSGNNAVKTKRLTNVCLARYKKYQVWIKRLRWLSLMNIDNQMHACVRVCGVCT